MLCTSKYIALQLLTSNWGSVANTLPLSVHSYMGKLQGLSDKSKGKSDLDKYQISSPVQGTLIHKNSTEDDELLSHNYHRTLPKSPEDSLKDNSNQSAHAHYLQPKRAFRNSVIERPGTDTRMPRCLPSGSQLPLCRCLRSNHTLLMFQHTSFLTELVTYLLCNQHLTGNADSRFPFRLE